MYTGRESSMRIPVSIGVLQGELSGPVVVRWYTTDGSALSSSDYDSINTTITFDRNFTRIVQYVSIINDDAVENPETLNATLTLESTQNGRAPRIDPKMAIIRIEDDDSEFVECTVLYFTVTSKEVNRCIIMISSGDVNMVYKLHPSISYLYTQCLHLYSTTVL